MSIPLEYRFAKVDIPFKIAKLNLNYLFILCWQCA